MLDNSYALCEELINWLIMINLQSMQSSSNIEQTEQELTEPEEINQNMIKKTVDIISQMSQLQRFAKAKAHIEDALKYKQPRYESESLSTPRLFKYLYVFQSSTPWDMLLFASGWVFLFLAALDSQSYAIKIGVEGTILFLFSIDTIILLYCKTFDKFTKNQRYSKFFLFKIIIILLMIIDLIVFICVPCYNSRPIRPFRILRCFVPLLFDPEMRKSLLSLASAYKDILVYFMFFASVIVGYALLGNRTLKYDPTFRDPNFPQVVDPYKTNFGDLSKMIFMVYVTATYDSYPDNQILVIQNSEPNYLYYIVFIFANMFLFSSIPGSLIYLKFRDTRSKILLIDEIRQQHSLILAFVTLAEQNTDLKMTKIISFLLYLYRYKIRYIEYITDICLRLDVNNSRSIQLNEFMQLSKLLLENSAMLPPTFDDIECWVQFRKYMNKTFHLKQIVKHWIFQLIISIIIILSFINAIFFMFQYTQLVEIFDSIFIWIFFVEWMVRIIAIGPQVFFMDRWNNVDTLLVALGLVYFFIPSYSNADGIVRMSRIFRLASLLRLMSHSNFMKGVNFEIWFKIKNIFSIILEIMPIILKFMHLFAFFFYIYVIFAMEVFYNFYDTRGSPAYNQYIQVGNFTTFWKGMYVMVQVLTEAGWSMVAFDHSWRAPYYYAYIMLFFCLCHITIVYIIATLIKGIFWEVFFTVNSIFVKRQRSTIEEEEKQAANIKKTAEIEEINHIVESKQFLSPDTILKREVIENKFDEQIFKKLINYYESQKINSNKKFRSKTKLLTEMYKDDWDAISSQNGDLKISSIKNASQRSGGQEKKQKISLNQMQEIEQEDFQTQISQIIQRLIVNPKVKYNQLIASPKIFIQFLQAKFKNPLEFVTEQFNMHFNPLYNEESMQCHVYQMHSILNIDPSKRVQKAQIIKNLIDDNIVTEEHGEMLVRKKLQQKVFNIDTNGTLRNLFLAGTNQDLIKKFETEYFSDIYGNSYKRINKLTLQPLLRCEATLTYALRNILRYPQIDITEFFQMLTHIEDQVSNKLLQSGSLFKFVYKLDCEGDIWFSIEYKHQQEMKIHFIKTGIWCYHKDMREKEVAFARDIFNWDFPEGQRAACEQYIKRFYQSFEGLAFSLLDEEQFFTSNPKDYMYDLYLQHFNVDRTSRFKNRRLEISKIMVVILSKEQERQDIGMKPLDYNLTDIKRDQKKKKRDIDFKFDESDNETFEKLKNLAAMQVDKIVQSEGLPFSYVINLMKEICEVVTINAQNFVYQIQKVLNEEYEEMKDQFQRA